MDAIVSLLRETIGLDASSIGLSAIERAVKQRLAICGLPGIPQYGQFVSESPKELRALIESVVVPETWFFRDPGAFTALAARAARAPGGQRSRFLSVPCATGEEPFSIAIAILDAGLPADRFHIEAVDVSERVLDQAESGRYGRNSFRAQNLDFRERYFKPCSQGWELDLSVRRMVSFRTANLLEDASLPGVDVYHAIFCRNLLIYFDSEMQTRALKTLCRLLAPDGLLFVAPAESGLMLRHGLIPSGLPLAFAFQKKQPVAKDNPLIRLKNATPLPSIRQPARPNNPTVPPSPVLSLDMNAKAPPQSEHALQLARALADQGRFEDVSNICRQVIDTEGASADAYYLLAMVSDASDRLEEATVFYRKALYLDPGHREALEHFSLLARKLGNGSTANALRDRALRLDSPAASE